MKSSSIMKLALVGLLGSAYVIASPPQRQSNNNYTLSKITFDNTCSGGGGTCNCSGSCSASSGGCKCT
jgi:hypothetical protein